MTCVYKDKIKCSVCEYVYNKQCKKFLVAHAKFMAKELLPFKYNSSLSIKDKVIQSSSKEKAKSAALKYAISKGLPVKKLTLSQVMSIVLNNDEADYNIVYIECAQKVFADVEKVKNVVQSFVDMIILHGGRVSIFNSQVSNIKFEYSKI